MHIAQKKVLIHAGILTEHLRELNQFSELFEQWARMQNLLPAKRMAIILKNDVEQLHSDLNDFLSCFKEACKQ